MSFNKETDYGLAYVGGDAKCRCGAKFDKNWTYQWYRGKPYCTPGCLLMAIKRNHGTDLNKRPDSDTVAI